MISLISLYPSSCYQWPSHLLFLVSLSPSMPLFFPFIWTAFASLPHPPPLPHLLPHSSSSLSCLFSSLNPHSAYSLIPILPLHLSFSLLPLTPFTLPLLAFSLPPPPDALPCTFSPLLLLLLTLSFLSPLHFHSPPPDSLPLS